MKVFQRLKIFFGLNARDEIGYYIENNYRFNPLFEAIKITLIYGLVGELWILFSDEIAARVANNMDIYRVIQIYKGGVYVFLTMLLIFSLVYSKLRLFKKALKEIGDNYTELEQHRNAVALSEERLELAVEGSGCGIWDWDLRNKNCYFSPKWKSLLGYRDEEIPNAYESWVELLYPEERDDVLSALNSYIHSKEDSYENIFRMKCKDGDFIWILCRAKAIRDPEGIVVRIAGTHNDITNEKLIEKKLHSLAYYDTLTELPNRFYFEEKVNQLITKNEDTGKTFALLYMDIDNFKNINDSLGHSSGDVLIQYIGEILKRQVNEPSFVARLGGDEFAIILDDMDSRQDIEKKIQDLLHSLRKPWVADNHEFFVSTSIGVALYPEHGDDLSILLKNADIAMYFVKKNSKDNYCFYSLEYQKKILEQITLVNYLRHAIDYDEFYLLYQPIMDLKDDSLVGAEVLIRWTHPQRGFISPGEFIPLAEETGLIYGIEKWVLKTALWQKKYWVQQKYPHIKVSINISGKSITSLEVIDELKQLLCATELKPHEIQLEVTETAVMQDLDTSIRVLKEIKTMGIEIALDDFGTGYSSLTYLKKLPIDVVKLDINFIRNIGTANNDRVIVEHMMKLIHDLKLKVVAEGIETEEQLTILKAMSCDYGQGYLYSRPINREDFMSLIEKRVS